MSQDQLAQVPQIGGEPTMTSSSQEQSEQQQQQAIPNSPATTQSSSVSSSAVSSRPPTSDQGDRPPNTPSRRSSQQPFDLLQPTLTSGEEQEEGGTTAAETFQDELEAKNSYQDEIAQEFEAYRQEYLTNKRMKQSSHQKSNRSKICQIVCVGLVMQVVTVAILLIVYLVAVKKQDEQGGVQEMPRGTPLGEYSNGAYLTGPPDNINAICSADNIQSNEEGLQECFELCKPSSCCHISHLEPGSCWLDNADVCHAYETACHILDPSSSDPTTANPQTLSDDTRITVFPNALILWEDPTSLPEAPDFLYETCKAAFVLANEWRTSETSAATQTCQETCDTARCCWDDSLTKAADRCWTHPNCAHYVEACNVVESTLKGNETTTTIPNGSFSGGFALSVPPPPAKITSFCHPANIENNLEDLLACHQACLPAECCWNSAMLDVNRCTYDPHCPTYAETCSVLNEPFLPPAAAAAVAQEDGGTHQDSDQDASIPTDSDSTAVTDSSGLYAPEVIWDVCYNHDNIINTGGPTLCEQVCAPGSCCHDPSHSGCPTTYADDFCDRFRPCQVLFNDEHTPEDYVEEACGNLSDLSECVKLCATATCCYTSDPFKACAATHPDIHCSSYTTCEVLYREVANDTPQESDRNGGRNLRAS